MASRIGRNSPCPCGSGKKYKKCHGDVMQDVSQQNRGNVINAKEIRRTIKKMQVRERQKTAQHGFGRQIVSAEGNGNRVVIVGKIIYTGKWATFFDFLSSFIRECLGKEWWADEQIKPLDQRHLILQWHHHFRLGESERGENHDGIIVTRFFGAASAYFRLAYNLYLIAHNSAAGSDKILPRLAARLRNTDQFQGAFFETQVAAWMIRAGFDLEYEDESDRRSSHCEFTAVFRATGMKFSVEAKSRQSFRDPERANRMKIASQFRKALEKKADHTRLVFLDVNHPITTHERRLELLERASSVLKKSENSLLINGMSAPPAYVAITNISDHYFLQESHTISIVGIMGFKIPGFDGDSLAATNKDESKHREMLSLLTSIKDHSEIPSAFDGSQS